MSSVAMLVESFFLLEVFGDEAKARGQLFGRIPKAPVIEVELFAEVLRIERRGVVQVQWIGRARFAEQRHEEVPISRGARKRRRFGQQRHERQLQPAEA